MHADVDFLVKVFISVSLFVRTDERSNVHISDCPVFCKYIKCVASGLVVD